MSSSSYWDSQYKNLMANKPPSSDSYYNQSFVDRMNEAQRDIDNLVSEKDKSYSAMNQKKDDYDAFSGTMREYGDVYNEAQTKFGVEEGHQTYEKSKKALALAESTLSALPSSINAASNRVLTQSQREARYNALADRATRQIGIMTQQNSMYEQAWKNARENQATYAKAEIASQYAKLGDFNTAWISAMNEYDNAVRRIQSAKLELEMTRSEYRMWQNQQWSQANTIWYNQLNNALTRYIEALDTEHTLYRLGLEKKMADSDAKINYWMNRGNERMGDMIANYYYNGTFY